MAPKEEKFKLTGELKKFVEVGKKNSRVLSTIERNLLASPPASDRRHDVLHPSQMVKSDWCHKASYFQLLGLPPAPSKYRLSMRQMRVFQLGHDIHAGWQNIFHKEGTLYGIYQCLDCGAKDWGMGVNECECGSTNHQYKEVKLTYEPLRIAGHADGILIGYGEPLLMEIKSLGAGTFRFEDPGVNFEHNGDLTKMWAQMKAPFMTHIMQAQLYMKLAELIGLPYQPQEAWFLYENKATQESKEFVIPKSDFGITPILDAAKMIVEAVDRREAPTCNISAYEGCYQCKGYSDDEVRNIGD